MAGKHCSLPPAALVTAAAFTMNLLYSGTYYITGLFLPHLLTTFGAGKTATVLVMSLMNGCLYSSGVVSGPLISKFGTRPVAAIGAVLASVGLILSSFAPHMWMLYICYGIITGFSWGFLMTAGAVSVQQHTTKRRALAAGISYIGSSIGGLTYPLLFRWLESIFGWRGTLLIIAALELNCLPAAYLLFPPDPVLTTEEVNPKLDGTLNIAEENIHESGNQALMFLMNESGKCPSNSRKETCEAQMLNTAVNQEDYSEKPDSAVTYKKPETKNLCSHFLHKVIEVALDTKATLKGGGLASVACIMAYVCRFTGGTVLYGFLPMKVTASGFETSSAAYLMSILHTGELVGRVVTAISTCFHDRLPLIVFVTAAITGGMLQALISYTEALMPIMIFAAGAGICMGASTCVSTTVVRDMVGIEKFPWVLGLAFGTAGISNLFIMQLLALLWEETGNISLLFIISGVSLACAGLSYVVYLGCCKRVCKPLICPIYYKANAAGQLM